MIDSDQDTGSRSMNSSSQRGQLSAVLIVAREQNHAARQRMPDATDIIFTQRRANHVQHHGA